MRRVCVPGFLSHENTSRQLVQRGRHTGSSFSLVSLVYFDPLCSFDWVLCLCFFYTFGLLVHVLLVHGLYICFWPWHPFLYNISLRQVSILSVSSVRCSICGNTQSLSQVIFFLLSFPENPPIMHMGDEKLGLGMTCLSRSYFLSLKDSFTFGSRLLISQSTTWW